jgi:hypothetical protein
MTTHIYNILQKKRSSSRVITMKKVRYKKISLITINNNVHETGDKEVY